MSILRRLFGLAEEPEEPTLPPLNDPILGELRWDADSEGWVGSVQGRNGKLNVYLGSGSAQEYPSDKLRELLRDPYVRFRELAEIALVYLRASGKAEVWKVDPSAFVVDGLQSFEHYVADGAYTITFANGDSGIWRVNFKNGRPVACGVDD